jgi:hypothetical protein
VTVTKTVVAWGCGEADVGVSPYCVGVKAIDTISRSRTMIATFVEVTAGPVIVDVVDIVEFSVNVVVMGFGVTSTVVVDSVAEVPGGSVVVV